MDMNSVLLALTSIFHLPPGKWFFHSWGILRRGKRRFPRSAPKERGAGRDWLWADTAKCFLTCVHYFWGRDRLRRRQRGIGKQNLIVECKQIRHLVKTPWPLEDQVPRPATRVASPPGNERRSRGKEEGSGSGARGGKASSGNGAEINQELLVWHEYWVTAKREGWIFHPPKNPFHPLPPGWQPPRPRLFF